MVSYSRRWAVLWRSQGSSDASRIGAMATNHDRVPGAKGVDLPRLGQRQATAQWRVAADGHQLVANRIHLDGEAKRKRAVMQPLQMQIKIATALGRPVAQRLNQAGAVRRKLVKRAFQRAASYSSGAVLSQTTPPPAFSVTCPASTSKLRIVTLNSDHPSGAAQPIVPQ